MQDLHIKILSMPGTTLAQTLVTAKTLAQNARTIDGNTAHIKKYLSNQLLQYVYQACSNHANASASIGKATQQQRTH